MHSLLPGWNFENRDPMDGVEPSSIEETVEGAVGGQEEEQETELSAPDGKIVGRSRRKAQQTAKKHEVPVELHVPKEPNLQVLNRGTPSPHSPGSREFPQSKSPYQDLERRNHSEHAYVDTRMGNPHSPRTPNDRDPPYEEMNVNRQYRMQHSPHGPQSPQGAYNTRSPPTPTSLNLQRTPGADQRSLHSQHSPHSPSGRTQNTPYSPNSLAAQNQSRAPVPEHYRSDDRYNTDNVNNKQTTAKTYLTDDRDDGGFSERSPRTPAHDHYGNDRDDGGFSERSPRTPAHDRYGNDTNYNIRSEPDRHGNMENKRGGYDPKDRYNDSVNDYGARSKVPYSGQRSNMGPKDNNMPTGQPVPAPRGFHRQQGSGRSDTSASDSGFGEIDYAPSSKYQTNKHHTSAYGSSGIPSDVKTPYYNHAYEPEESDDSVLVTDIMAKHKAVAAQMLQDHRGVPNGGSNYDRTDRYSDSNYTHKSSRWQDGTNGAMPKTRLQSDSQQIEESFI